MTDKEWFILIKESPQKAHRILIDQYSALVYAIVLSKLKGTASREEIEDCVSDVFVEIFINTDKYQGSGSIKSYISTIAKRKAINTYKSIMYRQRNTGYIEDEEKEIPENSISPDKQLEKKQLSERLWAAVEALGEPDSSIIIYQYVYNMNSKAIGEKLSMTSAAVRKRSNRARESIRTILESENIL